MANLDPLKFGVTGNHYLKSENKDAAKKEAAQQTGGEKVEKQIASKDVLSFLEAKNAAFVPVKAPKVLDVGKHVSVEQQARIEDLMKGFEAKFDAAVGIAVNEFGLSPKAAEEVALAYIENSY